MGRIALRLTEQANELGYSSIDEAIADGYEIQYLASGNHNLIKRK